MSTAVIKPAAWLRSSQALQSAKNNVRRAPGSDGDSLRRLRWRPGTGAQRCSLALLARCGRTSRSGAASAAGSAARVPSARTPGLSCPAADSRASAAAVRHRAAVSEQPSRDREFARSTCPRVCALTGAARPLGLHQVAAEGGWLLRAAPGRAGFLARRAGGSAKAGRGGAAGSGRASKRLRGSFGALCVPRHSVGSAPPRRHRAGANPGLRAGRAAAPRGPAAPLPHLGRRKVKWKTVAELSPPPPSPPPLPRRRRSLGRRWGGKFAPPGWKGKQGGPGPCLPRLPLGRVPGASRSISLF